MWLLLDVLQLVVLYTGVGFQFGLGSISYSLLNEIAPYYIRDSFNALANWMLYLVYFMCFLTLSMASASISSSPSSIFESLRLQVHLLVSPKDQRSEHCSSLQAGRAPTFHCGRCVRKNPVGRDLTCTIGKAYLLF